MKETNEYYLMHKDIAVCLMEINDDGGISQVRRNSQAADHFPLGGRMNDIKFRDWWNDRAIPKTRHGVKTALQKLGYRTTGNALVNNLALSLSDCYWIMPRGEDLDWESVNLFSNEFIDTFGDITLNEDRPIDLRNKTKFDCASSPGELQKKWCIAKDGRRYMVKGNYGDSYQQSLNECFATILHKQQGFKNYTEYSPVKITVTGGTSGLGCISYDFCNENVESIPAWELLQTIKTRQNESLFYPFKEVCASFGISDEAFTEFMDYEIMTDYLLSNTDRHMNNISLIRNPDTLEFLGFAPIYDSGNSMFYNFSYEQLYAIDFNQLKVHSFILHEKDLLKYVQNRDAIDLNKTETDMSIYEMDITERHMRIPRMKELYNRKRDNLSMFQNGKNIWKNSYVC